MQREFRGGEGASVPTNTVVLEIVRDEPGWVSWLCSVGSGRGGWAGGRDRKVPVPRDAHQGAAP